MLKYYSLKERLLFASGGLFVLLTFTVFFLADKTVLAGWEFLGSVWLLSIAWFASWVLFFVFYFWVVLSNERY